MKTKQFLSYHTMTTDFVWWHLYFDDWGRICFEKWEPWLQFFFLDPHMCVFVFVYFCFFLYLCICVHFEKQKPLLQFSFPVHSSIAMFRKEFTLALPVIVIINNINNNSIININNNNNNIINNTNNCKVDIAIILNTWSPQSNNRESQRDHQQFVHWQRPPGKEGKEGTES